MGTTFDLQHILFPTPQGYPTPTPYAEGGLDFSPNRSDLLPSPYFGVGEFKYAEIFSAGTEINLGSGEAEQ
jgi:hypothetical protein